MNKFELYLGRHKPDGFLVSPAQFRQFLTETADKTLTGYTVLSARGYWEGEPEESFLLTYLGEAWDDPVVRSIGAAYCRQFTQHSVYFTAQPLAAATLLTASDAPISAEARRAVPLPLGLM